MTNEELDKACEWLIKNWVTYINPITNTITPAFDFAQSFRKAMEAVIKESLTTEYDAEYLQSKIDAFSEARRKDGKTADEMLDDCRGGALELNWQDVAKIVEIADAMIDKAIAGEFPEHLTTPEAYYTEILKRFKEQ